MVSDELLNVCEQYAAGPDKGQKFFRELAAKQLAVFKGLGFAAGYLGGIAKPETFGEIIDLAESFRRRRLAGFHQGNPVLRSRTSFSSSSTTRRAASASRRGSIRSILASLQRPRSRRKSRSATGFRGWCIGWRSPAIRGFSDSCGGCLARWDKRPGIAAALTYGAGAELEARCFMAARIAAIAACPTAPISARGIRVRSAAATGPCGGSANGRCELDDKECFWARIYERLKSYGESERMLEGPPDVLQRAVEGHVVVGQFLSRPRSHAPEKKE